MRISDWSSDFCSSDLQNQRSTERCGHKRPFEAKNELSAAPAPASPLPPAIEKAIGGKNAYVITPEGNRSEEHTSELQSLMRISYAVFCLKKKKLQHTHINKKKHIQHSKRKQTTKQKRH